MGFWDRRKEENVACPRCNKVDPVLVPGKFICSACGCKFAVDRSRGMVEFIEQNGKTYEKYHFNSFPTWKIVYYCIASLFIMAYGTIGLTYNDIYIPGKHSPGVHLHGLGADLMYGAMLFGSFNMISIVVDHFDHRDNERSYRLFARVTSLSGWFLFLLALGIQLFSDLARL
jgi:hypothetical protein